eukprot:TRINITY_DN19293_c0_g1_i1.p1 TRINITY_DN19293_c0_g1~~TRINITY_DN19293_c0_g1_i1.p1  ORF type:complete len:380 (-),score=30.79 TRINITY_DN19293_c0_g1_i1:25-1164(-)
MVGYSVLRSVSAASHELVWDMRADIALPSLYDNASLTDALQIPRVFHRSHRWNANQIIAESPRLHRNLVSCFEINPHHETRYYDNTQVEEVLQHFVDLFPADPVFQSALQNLRREPFASAFVLLSDWFRLAVLHLFGGWWLDADVRCIDSLDITFKVGAGVANAVQASISDPHSGHSAIRKSSLAESSLSNGCVFAWEGELPQDKSSALNWAFGCSANHPFLLHTMRELAHRVIALRTSKEHDAFSAKVEVNGEQHFVDVLHTTGPGMLGDALGDYAKMDLRRLREKFGEIVDKPETWDAVSSICLDADEETPVCHGLVVLLPYCFFRSRGCKHLARRFHDRVVFHHEFDTSWRPSYWHNYFDDASVEHMELASDRVEL